MIDSDLSFIRKFNGKKSVRGNFAAVFTALVTCSWFLFSTNLEGAGNGDIPATASALAANVSSGSINPYEMQIAEQVSNLTSKNENVRLSALRALGFMRAYAAEGSVLPLCVDSSSDVRAEAAQTLAWIGGRKSIPALLGLLDDSYWITRQSAALALERITGMDFPFDALAEAATRAQQTDKWRSWCKTLAPDMIPAEVLDLLKPQGKDVPLGRTALEKNYFSPDKDIPPQEPPQDFSASLPNLHRHLRGIRAIGSLGGKDASIILIQHFGFLTAWSPEKKYGHLLDQEGSETLRQTGFSLLHALGRLHETEGLGYLITTLKSDWWARYAADALGDFSVKGGGEAEQAASALLDVYHFFSKDLERKLPVKGPFDDMSPPNGGVNRVHETCFKIGFALTRLPCEKGANLEKLHNAVLITLANLPAEFDATMIYERNATQNIAWSLLEKAGLRRAVLDAAYRKLQVPEELLGNRPKTDILSKFKDAGPDVLVAALAGDACDIPPLLHICKKTTGSQIQKYRLQAARTLGFLHAEEAADTIAAMLASEKAEGEYGFNGVFMKEEFYDPAPRYREAFCRLLGHVGNDTHVAVLAKVLEDENSVLEVRFAAAQALDELGTPRALEVLQRCHDSNPFQTVQMVAREALWKRKLPLNDHPKPQIRDLKPDKTNIPPLDGTLPPALVFVKADQIQPNSFEADFWRKGYAATDAGPVYRVGRNLCILSPVSQDGSVKQITDFKDGYVANPSVSYDGKKILFSARGGMREPWWHLYEINIDGSGLKQLTSGPYHYVSPIYLQDGRIVCGSSRLGTRDEYHGTAATGLTIMNPDGSDIRVIGLNVGKDNEPFVMQDGRIGFARTEVFYSELKLEIAHNACFPDGSKNFTIYGPEYRNFWGGAQYKLKDNMNIAGGVGGRHRALCFSQIQALPDGKFVCGSLAGPAIYGPNRICETKLLTKEPDIWAITSPYPLGNDKILCSATKKNKDDKWKTLMRNEQGWDPEKIDHGIYVLDASTQELKLIYNDPATSELDARPIVPRKKEPFLEGGVSESRGYAGTLFCSSAFTTQIGKVKTRGKWLRVVEGIPYPGRHNTSGQAPFEQQIQTSTGVNSMNHINRPDWNNHCGSIARVLRTIPLLSDGSFKIDVPADRLMHLQILDSDRQVIGNQMIWMYVRSNEKKGCVGCHESPDQASSVTTSFLSARQPAVSCFPVGNDFLYLAKVWPKGNLTDEHEEQTRTARAVNFMGRQ